MRNWLIYIPLFIFMTIGFGGGVESIERWQLAWKASSVIALLAIFFELRNLESTNRIFLGVNIFLIIGGFMAWLNLGQWLEIYGGLFRGVSLFAVLTFVGITTTMFSQKGYINSTAITKQKLIFKYSWVLVFITILSGFVSYLFRENKLLEGTLPFLLVYVFSIYLQRKVDIESE